MPKRSSSQHVPKEMQAHFEEITQLTDAFCQTYLNNEYQQLCRELTATLCRKHPSPLVRGKDLNLAVLRSFFSLALHGVFQSASLPDIANG